MTTKTADLLVSIWASYEFLDTLGFQADYDKLVRGINAPPNFTGQFGRPGACDGQDLLPNYFGPRKAAQLVVAIINFLGLIGSIFFTYKLYHVSRISLFNSSYQLTCIVGIWMAIIQENRSIRSCQSSL